MAFTIDDLNKKIIENLRFNAIHSLNPDAQFNIDGKGELHFHHTDHVLTEDEINAEMDRLQKLWDNHEYARLRASEYPDIKDYLDGVVKGDQKQIQAYIDACQAVKDKYPKP